MYNQEISERFDPRSTRLTNSPQTEERFALESAGVPPDSNSRERFELANNKEENSSDQASNKMLEETQSTVHDSTAQCQPSPAYNGIIDLLLNSYYDPSEIKEDTATLKNKYNCQIKTNTDAVSFADKAIEELNLPYTDLYTKSELDVMSSDLAGEYYGVGMSLSNIDRPGAKTRTRIDEIASGGAAEAAGLKAGDQILSIDGTDVRYFDQKQIASMLRSTKPDALSIKVFRDGEEKSFENIQRKLIESNAVKKATMTDDGILHIPVATFAQEDTSDELKATIEKFPEAKAYIIDLRNNRGGLVQEALRSLSLFMGKGTLMTEQQRLNAKESGLAEGEVAYFNKDFTLTKNRIEVRKSYEHIPGIEGIGSSIPRHPDIVDKPVVILTDGNTASASEIFTAAMKDHHEGTVIGKKTFGKGIGQDLYKGLPEGAGIAITTMRIFSPDKHWVGDGASKRYGIQPDIEVGNNENAADVAVKFLRTKI